MKSKWAWLFLSALGSLYLYACSTSVAEDDSAKTVPLSMGDDPSSDPFSDVDDTFTEKPASQQDRVHLKKLIQQKTKPSKKLPFCKKIVIATSSVPLCASRATGACFCLGNPKGPK